MTQLSRLHDAAARSLELWSAMVGSRDLANLIEIVHPDAIFRSPLAYCEPVKMLNSMIIIAVARAKP